MPGGIVRLLAEKADISHKAIGDIKIGENSPSTRSQGSKLKSSRLRGS